MGTLSGLFDLTRSSIAADQAALNVTSNNVANQNTVGYVRQIASFTSGDSVTLSAGTDLAASGPTVTVSSQRDRVLEQRVQQQAQIAASSGAQSDALTQVESVFSLTGSSETAGATQIGTAIDSFFSSLTSFASSPTDAATRQTVLSAAAALATSFNSASSQLAQVNSGLNAQLSSCVTQLNALTTSIAKLNAQIGENSPNADAGALENQRQTAIAQLSQLVGLDQVATEGNGITLTTQGGAVLVAGSHAFALTAINSGGTIQIQDSSGTNINPTIQGGSIGGQLVAQGTTLPAITSALDSVAYRIATAVNAQNGGGTDATGAQGGPIFAVGSMAAGAAAAITLLPVSASAIASSAFGEGATGNTNALALGDLGTAIGGNGLTIAGQFAALLSQVGTQSSLLAQQTTTDKASLTQLTTQRDSLSGVSLDEEAANLSQYQRAYEAGAKVLSVLDTLLAAAINLGTETTVA